MGAGKISANTQRPGLTCGYLWISRERTRRGVFAFVPKTNGRRGMCRSLTRRTKCSRSPTGCVTARAAPSERWGADQVSDRHSGGTHRAPCLGRCRQVRMQKHRGWPRGRPKRAGKEGSSDASGRPASLCCHGSRSFSWLPWWYGAASSPSPRSMVMNCVRLPPRVVTVEDDAGFVHQAHPSDAGGAVLFPPSLARGQRRAAQSPLGKERAKLEEQLGYARCRAMALLSVLSRACASRNFMKSMLVKWHQL